MTLEVVEPTLRDLYKDEVRDLARQHSKLEWQTANLSLVQDLQ